MDYGLFRPALAGFWTDTYVTKCGMISSQVLKPLVRSPSREQWAEWVKNSKHAVAAAVKSAKSVPLAQSLSGWLATLQGAQPQEADGVAIATMIVGRFFGSHFDAVASMKVHMGLLDDESRAKVWAAIENMPVEAGEEPSALQAGIISLYEDKDVLKLCDALYTEVADSGAGLLETVDSLVDCIKDLVDMASVCSKSARPRRAAATPKLAPQVEAAAESVEVSEPAAPTPVVRMPSPPPAARASSPPPAESPPPLSPLRGADAAPSPPSPLESPPSAAMTEDNLLRAFVASMGTEPGLQPVQEVDDIDDWVDDYEDDDSPMIDLDEPEEAEQAAEQPLTSIVHVAAKPVSSYPDPIRSKILMALRETQAENRRVLNT
jgi:hypothetical protein